MFKFLEFFNVYCSYCKFNTCSQLVVPPVLIKKPCPTAIVGFELHAPAPIKDLDTGV